MLTSGRNRRVFIGLEEIPLGGNRTGGKTKGIIGTCATCGAQWGRVEIPCDLPPEYQRYFTIVHPCAEHTTPYQRGGSFFQALCWHPEAYGYPNAESLIKSLSREFLLYEARMKINQLEKTHHD